MPAHKAKVPSANPEQSDSNRGSPTLAPPCRPARGAHPSRYKGHQLPTLCSLLIAALLLAVGCGGKKRVKLPPPIPAQLGWTQQGIASWYGRPYHGRITSNGERYDMNKISAAHKRLPFDTWVRVRNLNNKKTVDVRINDRGPFVKGRIIDLSRAAAKKIEMIGPGTARVRIEVVATPGMRYRSGRRGRRREEPVEEPRAAPPTAPTPAVVPAEDLSPPQPQHEPHQDEAQGDPDPCAVAAFFGVQVGSFLVLENAELLYDKVTALHRDSRIVEIRLAQGTRYRVIVGRFARPAAARGLKQQLADDGVDGFVSEFEQSPPPDCL